MKRDTAKISTEPSSPLRLKVALVEDKADIRESWSRLINSFPEFSCVCVCTSGEEALRVISHNPARTWC